MKREWTPEQLEAITDRGNNLIVSAGAGSGKTAVMIERICSLLKEGHDIRRMLVCTFTKSAAADMKRKLAEEITESDDKALIEQLSYLPSADISTLHSWCSHILKTWFFDADFDPEFSVLEEGEELRLKHEAAEEVIAVQKESGDKEFAELYTALMYNRSHKRLTDSVVSVLDYSRAQPCPEEWLMRTAAYTDSKYRDFLYGNLETKAKKLLLKCERLICEHAAAKFELDMLALSELKDSITNGTDCTARTPSLRSGKEEYGELHERFKKLKKAYADLCERRAAVAEMPSHESSMRMCSAMGRLALETGRRYAELKRERVKVDFGDLEHGALKVLCGEHGDEIAGCYDFVFVDEYQDINPLQEKILGKFKCNMFYVGDVKQSVYGFRMCRPQFFIDKQREYASSDGGKALYLKYNFRSGSEVLDSVNEIFSSVMTKDFGKVDYKSERMITGKKLADAGGACTPKVTAVFVNPDCEKSESEREPQIYSVINGETDGDKPSLIREVEEVADEIADMLHDKEVINGEERYIEYGDIAVLVRSRGRFTDLLEKKLRSLSVPVAFVSGDSPADSFVSVSALLAFLRVLDNARDDVNLSAIMLSPMFGNFTLDELADIRRSGAGGFCDCVNGAAKKIAKVRDFMSGINALRVLSDEMTVAELAGEITSRYNCFNYALCLGGEREAAALDSFMEHLAAQENDVLHGYLVHVNRCGAPRLKVTDGGKAVKIMTVHGSKGLEFPCVILPELNKHFNVSDVYANVICSEEEGIVMRTYDFDERSVSQNPRFAACSAKLRRSLAEEELRILYVAMTRAQNRLSLFAVTDGEPDSDSENYDADSYSDWLYGFMSSCKPKARTHIPDCEKPELRSEPIATVTDELKKFYSMTHAVHTGGTVKASVSGVVRSDPDEKDDAPVLFSGDDRAAKRGSAYHKFMQWADFDAPAESEIKRLSAKFPADGELIDNPSELITAFENVKAFIAGRKFYREKAFVFNAPARISSGDKSEQDDGDKGDTVLIQGVIDLMVINPDGSVDIVDYKTGSREHLKSPVYRRQLGLYKSAVKAVLKREVKNTFIYGFHCGEFIKTE